MTKFFTGFVIVLCLLYAGGVNDRLCEESFPYVVERASAEADLILTASLALMGMFSLTCSIKNPIWQAFLKGCAKALLFLICIIPFLCFVLAVRLSNHKLGDKIWASASKRLWPE